ncbi:virB8 family protein [Pollutimonas bauzanensis]|uniref:Type IV secretion system protein VirB8 n=1 Tax=Pollutimonas bauzanensis TaxID=658167 RepID=A0A1M5YIH2_9BURK|nr:VirB8/TrbF family protein [Pollutimonas bauzanensis]SHI11712.1 type IV secretion system protein VirB8 [Pollutimonas bauzanensis]
MPSDDPKLSIDDEIARAQGLERDLLVEILQSRRTAWRVAIGAFVLALVSVGAVAGLTPLKAPPELYVVRVDNAKGQVESVTRLGDAQEDYGERIARFFIHEYVLACEGYDWNTIQNSYDRCALFSAPSVQREYYEKFKGDEGWIKRYANHTRQRINVRSITLGPKQSATVRFTRRIESNTNQTGVTDEHLVATLAYDYVNANLTEAVGRKNPLGFQVITYTTDVEVQGK